MHPLSLSSPLVFLFPASARAILIPQVQLLLEVCVFVFIRWAASNSMVFLSVGFFNACLDKQLGHNAHFALALFFSLFHSYPFIAQSTLLFSTRLDSNTPFSHSYSHSLTLTLDSHSHRHSHSSFSLIVVFRLLLIPFAFVSPCNHPRLYASNSFFRSFI